MGVGEGEVHREVTTNKEAYARYRELSAHEEDMFGVIEAAAVGACGVIRGGGAMTKGIVPLE
jgi:hypothetical protein